jgi:hypothetical protein
MYPVNFNQPLVEGMTMPGTERRKVTKTRTAFPMAAIFSSVADRVRILGLLTLQWTLLEQQVFGDVPSGGCLCHLVFCRQGEYDEKTTRYHEEQVGGDI